MNARNAGAGDTDIRETDVRDTDVRDTGILGPGIDQSAEVVATASALQPVVVGAGPAGIRAAQTLLAHGLHPIVIDEALRGGGQIYRRPPAGFKRSAATLYGTEASRATRLHDAFDGMAGRIDHRADTLVYDAHGGSLDLLHGATGMVDTLPYRDIIVATGATDRLLPVPGWTLPGVYSLGGSQVALKFQGCAIGQRVVFLGTGPLLYLVAYQYAKAGAEVAAVLDTARTSDRVAALAGMLTQPSVLAKGMYFVAWLLAHGVPLHGGVRPLRIEGDTRVTAVVFEVSGQAVRADTSSPTVFDRDSRRGVERRIECDAVGFGHALRSETQLADLLGCRFEFAPGQRAHLPVRDAAGRSSVEGVYLAGDGAGIMGADAAEWAGERAALALLADRGMTIDAGRGAELERRLTRLVPFRNSLERAFPFPSAWAAQALDELVVCRCENITAGQLRGVVRETGADEMNRLKALSRIGMGRCQGRMCGVAAAELLAHAAGKSIGDVGRLRGQAPIKPIPMSLTRSPMPVRMKRPALSAAVPAPASAATAPATAATAPVTAAASTSRRHA